MSSGAICDWKTSALVPTAWEPHTEDERELTSELERVDKLIDENDSEDAESLRYIRKEALIRAKAFLRLQSGRLRKICALSVPVPDMDLGPNGSIDLHWKRGDWELLVNIPAEPNDLAAVYGENGSQMIKASFDPKTFHFME